MCTSIAFGISIIEIEIQAKKKEKLLNAESEQTVVSKQNVGFKFCISERFAELF